MAIYKLRTEISIEVSDDLNAGMATALRVFEDMIDQMKMRNDDGLDDNRIVDYKHMELRHESMG